MRRKAMAGHTSEKRWDQNKFGDAGVGQQVRDVAIDVVDMLTRSENLYQDLLELWTFQGGTNQAVADQLFFEVWSTRVSDPEGAPDVFDTQANALEVAIVDDAKASMLATHQLYEALTNVAVAQADRIAPLRRMT